jgi:hypothetical protein
VGSVAYIGRNGSGNTDLEAAKTEALQLANEVTRAKLRKLHGDLVERKEVQYVIAHALTTLRERILHVPQIVSADLRGLEHAQVHAIRMRVDESVRRWLEELAETLARAVHGEDFFAAMDADNNAETDAAKDARERKRDLANAKRRAKRNAAKSK